MASNANSATSKKATVLGRSAATGRFVLVPATAGKSKLSDQRITAAVKGAFAPKK